MVKIRPEENSIEEQYVVITRMGFLDIYSRAKIFAFDVISGQVGKIAFSGLMLYSRYSERLKKQMNYIVKKYPIINDFLCITGYCFRCIQNICICRRIPPFYNTWFSVSHIYFRIPAIEHTFETVKLDCVMQEEFKPLDISNVQDTMLQWHKSTCSFMQQNDHIYDGLIAFQTTNAIIYRICRPGRTLSNMSYVTSNAKFLSIEVYLPNKKTSYNLDLLQNEYIVNNELFSPCFIKRYFEYHIGKHIFDIDYTVKIMDNDICSIELKKNRYIVLEENTYSIKQI